MTLELVVAFPLRTQHPGIDAGAGPLQVVGGQEGS